MENSSSSLQQKPKTQSVQKSRKKSKNKKTSDKIEFKSSFSIGKPDDDDDGVSNQTNVRSTFMPSTAIKAQIAQARSECNSKGPAGLSEQLDKKLNINELNHTSNGVSRNTDDDDNDDYNSTNTNTHATATMSTTMTTNTTAIAIANGHYESNGHEEYAKESQEPKCKNSQQIKNKRVELPHCQTTKDDDDTSTANYSSACSTNLENGFDIDIDIDIETRRNSNNSQECKTECQNCVEKQQEKEESIVGNQNAISSRTISETATPIEIAIAQKTEQELNTPIHIESQSIDLDSKILDLSQVHIDYKEYESELQMHDIMRLIQAELSEPYSIYTYRYFIYNWPKLCFLAAHGDEYVGAIVCKLDMHMNVRRGYIAMLAVRKEYRKLKIGTTLVQKAIEAMLADNADEVVLETEMRNIPALRLYENLGFVRDKRLFRYYLNGVDALRLKLWFR